ncbi:Gfo/Idh/MocA family oxidoreductase [Saccharopolyspora gregorii]|uniref:Gfo/Idh/MocA family oxidoreductase n=1 Tax=Saccharopolyspora gregorii TaxID=33914 RepID=A0ABP6RRS1_9PSEU
MSSLRLAVVGCGAAARGCHLPALARSGPQVRLTALVDRSPREAERALEVYRAHSGTGDVRTATAVHEVLDEFDAAVVVVPHTAHRAVAEDLLAHGKHVLLEKPMTTGPADARHLVERARSGAAVLAMAHPRRLFPAYAWVRRLIRSGELGDVRRVDWVEGAPYGWEPVSWSMFDRALAGGGVLTDTGAHVLDTLLWWFGPDVEVADYRDNSLGGVESDAELSLRFGPVEARVSLSRLRPLGGGCTVVGDRATATIGTDFPAGECTLITADGVELHRGDVAPVAPAQGEWELLFVEQLADFAAAVERGTAPHSVPADGLAVVDLIDRCYHGPARRAWAQPWITGDAGAVRA